MTFQEYLLVILIEECDETSQRATKAIRFGMEEIQKDQELNNAQRIIGKFNDLYAVMELLKENDLIDVIIDRELIVAKKEKIMKYYEYSKSLKIFD